MPSVRWDPAAETIDDGALDNIDAVVHLAGESIASSRWTDAQKARIMDSRVKGTRTLAKAMAAAENPPAIFLSG
ncbi:MAG: epimerase, partial [Actinobacteria bacterium]|nr:epimerase [Actinomycetota bacterium]